MAWILPAALLGSAAIGGITSLLSSNKAASTAKDTSAADLAFQKQLFNRELMQGAPYASAGYGALGDLATAYGQPMPRSFDPYQPLGSEKFGPATGTPGGPAQATWQSFLSQFPGASGGTPPPESFSSGNALADYLQQFRGQVGKKDRKRFDQHITQLRGMGAFPQQQAGAPAQPVDGSLEARRADFLQRFQDSPLYQMTYQPALEQGTKALDRNATAAGRLNSGRAAKEMARFAGDLGKQTYGGYESGLWNMAGFGPGQTPSGTGVSNAIQSGANAGYAQAAGIQGVGNAVNNALGSYAYLQGLRNSSQFA